MRSRVMSMPALTNCFATIASFLALRFNDLSQFGLHSLSRNRLPQDVPISSPGPAASILSNPHHLSWLCDPAKAELSRCSHFAPPCAVRLIHPVSLPPHQILRSKEIRPWPSDFAEQPSAKESRRPIREL